MHAELEARALYKKGNYVKYNGANHIVSGRYYRQSEDRFLYDLGKVTIGQRRAPKVRKVKEEELEP
jgi:hypothetical protein